MLLQRADHIKRTHRGVDNAAAFRFFEDRSPGAPPQLGHSLAAGWRNFEPPRRTSRTRLPIMTPGFIFHLHRSLEDSLPSKHRCWARSKVTILRQNVNPDDLIIRGSPSITDRGPIIQMISLSSLELRDLFEKLNYRGTRRRTRSRRSAGGIKPGRNYR